MKAQRQKEYQVARSLEQKGQTDAAVAVYLRYEDVDEASRALIAAGRFTDAGDLLMDALNVKDDELNTLNERERKRAAKAAVCYAKAGDTAKSVGIHLGIGDSMQAIRTLELAGDHTAAGRIRAQQDSQRKVSLRPDAPSPVSAKAPQVLEAKGDLVSAMRASIQLRDYGSAARLAYKLGKPKDAAELSIQAGLFYEAGMSFKAAGEPVKALEALCRVDKDGPKYRAAALQAIALAMDQKSLEFEFDRFVTPFAQSLPRDTREAAAFYHLARLYQKQNLPDSALAVLERVQDYDARYRDVSALIVEMRRDERGGGVAFRHVVEEDARFRALDEGPRSAAAQSKLSPQSKLPSLPPLEGPEPTAGPATAAAPVASLGGFRPVVPAASAREEQSTVRSEPDRAPPTALPTDIPADAEVAEAESPIGALTIGAVVLNRYEIQRELGRGGMAAVYQAYDRELEEAIALKFFFAGEATPDLVKRFKQELTLSRRLSHPNIVGVYDIGTHRGCKFMSMELLQGMTLTSRIREGLELAEGLGYLAQACDGLHAAHTQSIVHRDIKPDNLFITREGVLKVMDFGIAKHQTGPAMTRAGFMAGTPEYIAPEQINNFGSVSHLADVYAIGVVAYEIATGTVPFAHEALMPLLQMHMLDSPEPPSIRRPGLPRALELAILKCLEKKPTDRFSNAAEVSEIFRAIQKELM